MKTGKKIATVTEEFIKYTLSVLVTQDKTTAGLVTFLWKAIMKAVSELNHPSYRDSCIAYFKSDVFIRDCKVLAIDPEIVLEYAIFKSGIILGVKRDRNIKCLGK